MAYDIGPFEYVATGTTVNASSASFSLAAQSATVSANRTAAASSASYTLASQAATVDADRTVSVSAGAFTLAGQAATVSADRTVAASAGAYTKADQAATVVADRTVNVSAGAFTLAAQSATVSADRTVAASAGAYSLAAQNANVSGTVGGASVSASAGAFTLAGQSATVSADRSVIGSAGAFTLAEQAATVSADRTVSVGAGAFTLAAQSATVSADRTVSASAGAFTVAGQAATVSADRTVSASAAAFTLTGYGASIGTGAGTTVNSASVSYLLVRWPASVSGVRFRPTITTHRLKRCMSLEAKMEEIMRMAATRLGYSIDDVNNADDPVRQMVEINFGNVVETEMSNYAWHWAEEERQFKCTNQLSLAYTSGDYEGVLDLDCTLVRIRAVHQARVALRYDRVGKQLFIWNYDSNLPVNVRGTWYENVAAWPAGFKEVIVCRIAAMIGTAILQKPELGVYWDRRADVFLARAQGADSQQQTNDKLSANQIATARGTSYRGPGRFKPTAYMP